MTLSQIFHTVFLERTMDLIEDFLGDMFFNLEDFFLRNGAERLLLLVDIKKCQRPHAMTIRPCASITRVYFTTSNIM